MVEYGVRVIGDGEDHMCVFNALEEAEALRMNAVCGMGYEASVWVKENGKWEELYA